MQVKIQQCKMQVGEDLDWRCIGAAQGSHRGECGYRRGKASRFPVSHVMNYFGRRLRWLDSSPLPRVCRGARMGAHSVSALVGMDTWLSRSLFRRACNQQVQRICGKQALAHSGFADGQACLFGGLARTSQTLRISRAHAMDDGPWPERCRRGCNAVDGAVDPARVVWSGLPVPEPDWQPTRSGGSGSSAARSRIAPEPGLTRASRRRTEARRRC